MLSPMDPACCACPFAQRDAGLASLDPVPSLDDPGDRHLLTLKEQRNLHLQHVATTAQADSTGLHPIIPAITVQARVASELAVSHLFEGELQGPLIDPQGDPVQITFLQIAPQAHALLGVQTPATITIEETHPQHRLGIARHQEVHVHLDLLAMYEQMKHTGLFEPMGPGRGSPHHKRPQRAQHTKSTEQAMPPLQTTSGHRLLEEAT